MLGCVKGQDSNTFSEEKVLTTLSKNTESRCGLCRKIYPLQKEENARIYLSRIRKAVWQNCFVLIILAVISIIVIGVKGDWDFSDKKINNMLILFRAIKGISAIIAIAALIHFGILCDSIPEMKGFSFIHKFIVLKLGILFTEIQPNVIEIFSNNISYINNIQV